ncbi:MAG: PilZ domain-containing protein [Acidobacteriia bacterium]|nr:PilZ domain-containing protein [Terriglobia bacterium]
MSSTASAQKGQRGSRVKLLGSVLALVLLENGRQIRARINQLSVNGALLSLENPLNEGIRVTILFHIGFATIRCRSQMLFPMWATQGCLQPLKFLELPDTDRACLARELEALVRAGAPQEEDDVQ